MTTDPGTVGALVGLGVWHGINPAMGWLFAVALGLQGGSGRAVWRALPPLAAGHAAAIAITVALAGAIGVVIPLGALQWVIAAVLVSFGVWRLVSGRHPRYGGMRMRQHELALWSGLMASAHGAGLMVVPFVLRGGGGVAPGPGDHAGHLMQAGVGPGAEAALRATAFHTLGYLVTACLVAVAVYRWAGLGWLRRAWVNVDRVWGVALVVTGVVTPLM